jgi:hypothetical protein
MIAKPLVYTIQTTTIPQKFNKNQIPTKSVQPQPGNSTKMPKITIQNINYVSPRLDVSHTINAAKGTMLFVADGR